MMIAVVHTIERLNLTHCTTKTNNDQGCGWVPENVANIILR